MTRFKKLLKISSRNVFRNKRRTLLTLSILILGSSGLILVGGFFDAVIHSLGEYFIYSQTGHLQVSHEKYFDRGTSAPFKYLLHNTSDIEQQIESHSQVQYTVPRLKFGGLLSTADTNISALVYGVNPIKEQMMGSRTLTHEQGEARTATMITEGKDLDPNDPYGIILGRGLMKALNLKVGDSVTLLITREFGAIDGADFHVRGEFTTQLKDFDERVLKMNLSTLQSLFGVPDQIHSLLVILRDTKHTESMAKSLAEQFRQSGHPLEIIPWQQQATYYHQSEDFLGKIYLTVQFILSIVFFFSIANTINMNLFERLREFGTMMALGNSRGTIIQMIMFEGVFIGLIGATLGLLIGCAAAVSISSIGITLPPPPMGSFPYDAAITLKAGILAQVFIVVFCSTLFASLIPAYRASHFRIIAALGHV